MLHFTTCDVTILQVMTFNYYRKEANSFYFVLTEIQYHISKDVKMQYTTYLLSLKLIDDKYSSNIR